MAITTQFKSEHYMSSNIFIKTKTFLNHYVNFKLGLAGGLFLGCVVFYINLSHGYPLALAAASKQAAYSFLFAGLITRNNEKLALRGEQSWLTVIFAAGISSSIAIGLTFIVHNLKGTPEPLMSTLPTMLTAPFSFAALAWREQQKTNEDQSQEQSLEQSNANNIVFEEKELINE